jgi:hypothetical protein
MARPAADVGHLRTVRDGRRPGLPTLSVGPPPSYRQGMACTGQWKVDVFLFEDEAEVTAEAVLHADAARPVVGRGTARLGTNATVPEIGAELATSRALAALGHRLLELTAEDLAALPTSAPAGERST